jgi:hypothetical protein
MGQNVNHFIFMVVFALVVALKIKRPGPADSQNSEASVSIIVSVRVGKIGPIGLLKEGVTRPSPPSKYFFVAFRPFSPPRKANDNGNRHILALLKRFQKDSPT